MLIFRPPYQLGLKYGKITTTKNFVKSIMFMLIQSIFMLWFKTQIYVQRSNCLWC